MQIVAITHRNIMLHAVTMMAFLMTMSLHFLLIGKIRELDWLVHCIYVHTSLSRLEIEKNIYRTTYIYFLYVLSFSTQNVLKKYF